MIYFPEEEKEGGMIYVILLNEKRKTNFKDDGDKLLSIFLVSNHSDYITFNTIGYLLYISIPHNN